MHTLISGRSGSGKSTLAFHLAKIAIKRNNIVVFDPFESSQWPSCKIFTDIDELKNFLENNYNYIVFFDEAGVSLNRYDAEHNWFSAISRHYGHKMNFIGQRWSQFNPLLRANCSNNFILNQPTEDIDKIIQEYNVNLELTIPRFCCYWIRPFARPVKLRVDKSRIYNGWTNKG